MRRGEFMNRRVGSEERYQFIMVTDGIIFGFSCGLIFYLASLPLRVGK
jgi:hypothetical protein